MRVKTRASLAFLVFWMCFGYVWLVWGWKDTSELFSAAWWFDEAGHMLYGIMGGYTLLYYYQNYTVSGAFRLFGKLFLASSIISKITLWGVYWEIIEFVWDIWLQPAHFDWLGKAQSDSLDTSIDIILNSMFARIAMVLYGLYNMLYKKWYPDENEYGEIEDIKNHIRYLSDKIARRRHTHIKDIIPSIREELKELFQTIRTRRNKNKTA